MSPTTGSATSAPRVDAFARSFEDHVVASICAPDYAPPLRSTGARIGELLDPGCLVAPPCPGATAADLRLQAFPEGAPPAELVPDLDFTLRPEGACASGWRIDLDETRVAPRTRVEVVHACDGGDGCT